MLHCREVCIRELDKTSQCANCCAIGLLDIHIHKVQALDRRICSAKQRSGHTLDGVSVTIYHTCITLNWSPRLACHIYIVNEQNILLESCCLFAKCFQRSHIAHNKQRGAWEIVDTIRELTNFAHCQRLGVVGFYGCVHYATLGIVESYIYLVILARRDCNVEIGWLARKLDTLAKRVLDYLL